MNSIPSESSPAITMVPSKSAEAICTATPIRSAAFRVPFSLRTREAKARANAITAHVMDVNPPTIKLGNPTTMPSVAPQVFCSR